MKRYVASLVLLVAAGAVVSAVGPGQTTATTSTPEIMRQKLEEAQQLLAALVRAELEEVGAHTEELHDLSELQSWYVLPTPEYAEHSQQFREAAQSVVRAAERMDEAATFDGYVSLVRKCVDCHAYMRRVRGPGEPPPP